MSTFFRKRLHKYCYNPQKRGYVTLMSVLVLGAVGVTIITSVLLLSVDSSRTSNVLSEIRESQTILESCVEEALERIRRNASVTGYGSLAFVDGSCGYEILNTGGSNRTIQASSTRGNLIHRLVVMIDQVNPRINVASWQRVDSF